jgi:NAD(P)-dependent dehydrogenase (short-subunit alcohol dehydrogenase family)
MSKVVLITGGSRGIGRAAALLCAARGWSVGVNYATNRDAADETVARVEAAGGRAIAIQGDVSRKPMSLPFSMRPRARSARSMVS